jgi:lysophospholipase L1-like esterase
MGVEVRTNSAGFRDEEYSLARTGKKRAIILGDSLTLGWGVRKEDTFEARLERELGEAGPVEIINFGQGNFNTDQEVGLFLKQGLGYKPDLVVVFYFINDPEETPRKSQLGAVLGRSRFLTLLWSRVNALWGRLSGRLDFKAYYSALYADSFPGWVKMKQAFEELRDTCRREGIHLEVVLLPDLHELAPYPFTAEHRKVGDVLSKLGVPFLDLAPGFAGIKDSRSLWVAPDDAHPNAKAHAMISELTKNFIAKGFK